MKRIKILNSNIFLFRPFFGGYKKTSTKQPQVPTFSAAFHGSTEYLPRKVVVVVELVLVVVVDEVI